MLASDHKTCLEFDQRFDVEVSARYHAVHVHHHGIDLAAAQLF
jgi:hypothetical protein